jgi:hypothetical protein
VLPNAEHRFCVRHLHANLKLKGYTGKAFKDEVWGAARATNIHTFNYHMQRILAMDKGAHKYLCDVPKSSWSRHAFSCHTKSELLLNNLAESFNAWIKDARSKPILTMCEETHRQLMARFQQKRKGIQSTNYVICPKAHRKLEKAKSDARNCISRWQNEQQFEVDHMYDARRLVQLDERTCTCGRWQLSGIPCSHACAAIYMLKEKSEEYVDEYLKMGKYMLAYADRVYGMEGPQTWPADDECDPILPPNNRKAPGRPKVSRKKATDEPPNPYKLTRSGYVVKCANCGGLGHNYKGCHLPLNPDRKRWKQKTVKKKTDAANTQVKVRHFSTFLRVFFR